jgi:predicted lipoprotein with Yx(FWY)xxD motif
VGRLTAIAIGLAVVVAAIVAATVMGRSSTHKAPSDAKPASADVSVRVAQTRLGHILVDGQGRTLYLYVKDRGTQSACGHNCERVWPPAVVSGEPQAGPGVAAAKLTTVRRADSRRQLVYNGHPLYTLSADTRPGQINGEGFLGTWFVLSPAGNRIGKLNPSAASEY